MTGSFFLQRWWLDFVYNGCFRRMDQLMRLQKVDSVSAIIAQIPDLFLATRQLGESWKHVDSKLIILIIEGTSFGWFWKLWRRIERFSRICCILTAFIVLEVQGSLHLMFRTAQKSLYSVWMVPWTSTFCTGYWRRYRLSSHKLAIRCQTTSHCAVCIIVKRIDIMHLQWRLIELLHQNITWWVQLLHLHLNLY